ncbi:MAG: hypothetical protein AAGK37_07970 [Pseudomonadota bacterium]
MQRRTLILSSIAFAAAPPAVAQSSRLTAAEIEELLSGQRIKGDWNGTQYDQVFWENGGTLYTPQGAPSDHGKWRVNAAENTYESWWENSGWSSYAIEQEDGALYWVDSRDKRYPFEVLPGE